MRFCGEIVPGASWVEIVQVTNKDGSPLAPDNWRQKLFGRISMCWIAGGFRYRGAFFRGKIRMEKGEVVEVDLDSSRWCSTTTAHPVEVEPGIFEFETNTSIYRFRLLTEEEEAKVTSTIRNVVEYQMHLLMQRGSAPSENSLPN